MLKDPAEYRIDEDMEVTDLSRAHTHLRGMRVQI